MLNTFPTLLSFSFLATALLRITAGIIFIYFGLLKITKDKKDKIHFFEVINLKPAKYWLYFIAFTEIISGLLITIGLFTQIASIIASIIMFITIIIKTKKPSALPNTTDFYILFFVVFFVLIFMGAGAFAIDIPI